MASTCFSCEKNQRFPTGLSCPSELKLRLRLRSTVPLGSPPLLPPALTSPDANWSILPSVVPANRTGSPLAACVQATQVKSDSSWEQISAMSLHIAEIQYIDKARVRRRILNWKSCPSTKTNYVGQVLIDWLHAKQASVRAAPTPVSVLSRYLSEMKGVVRKPIARPRKSLLNSGERVIILSRYRPSTVTISIFGYTSRSATGRVLVCR